MKNKLEILIPEATYHIYNRANGSERLFISNENYRYFLQQYQHYISPIAHTFCYCLMPNHFHFLIKIKTENEILQYFKKDLQGFENLEGLISKQFSNFFNAYAKAFNKAHKRKGNLFMHTFKRKRVTETEYLLNLVYYIHFNPIEGKLAKTLTNWKYSSYNALSGSLPTFLKVTEVISWFDDNENFIAYHSQPHEIFKPD